MQPAYARQSSDLKTSSPSCSWEEIAQLADRVCGPGHGVAYGQLRLKDLKIIAALHTRRSHTTASANTSMLRRAGSEAAPQIRNKGLRRPQPACIAISSMQDPRAASQAEHLGGCCGSGNRRAPARAAGRRRDREAGKSEGYSDSDGLQQARLEGLVAEEVDLVKVVLDVPQAVRLVPALQHDASTAVRRPLSRRVCPLAAFTIDAPRVSSSFIFY